MAKFIGFGTILKASTTVTAGTTPVDLIGQIESIEGPSAERGTGDVTTLDSTAREFLPTIRDGGTVDFPLTWDPVTPTTGHQWLKNRYNDGAKGRFRIEWPGSSATAITFNGYVVQFQPSFPLDDKITAAVSIKVTDAVEWPT